MARSYVWSFESVSGVRATSGLLNGDSCKKLKKTLLIIPLKMHSIPHSRHLHPIVPLSVPIQIVDNTVVRPAGCLKG